MAQIGVLNKQLQDSAAENFELRGSLSAYQRNVETQQGRLTAFERERQSMLDIINELTRAVGGFFECYYLSLNLSS